MTKRIVKASIAIMRSDPELAEAFASDMIQCYVELETLMKRSKEEKEQ